MWIIKEIYEADYGCEERMPGEPLMIGVMLECDDGRIANVEVADIWLSNNELKEGDEWPEDIEEINPYENLANKQMEFMESYYEALEELD